MLINAWVLKEKIKTLGNRIPPTGALTSWWHQIL